MQARISPITRFNQILLFVVLFFGILYFAKPFFIPLAIGAMLAMLLVPFCRRLERLRIPRGLASACCALLALVLLLGIGYRLPADHPTYCLGKRYACYRKEIE